MKTINSSHVAGSHRDHAILQVLGSIPFLLFEDRDPLLFLYMPNIWPKDRHRETHVSVCWADTVTREEMN